MRNTNLFLCVVSLLSFRKMYLKIIFLFDSYLFHVPVSSHPLNSSPPSGAYMCQWTGSSLVQVMACHLIGAKPLPEPMLVYCQPDSWEQISMKFESEFCHFHSRKCIWKWCLPKWQPFCAGGDEWNGEMNFLVFLHVKIMFQGCFPWNENIPNCAHTQ